MRSSATKHRISTKFGVYLPELVPIGGVTYRLIDRPLRGKRTFGDTNALTLTIIIDVAKHATVAELLQTFEHETRHAIVYETGNKRNHKELNVEAHMGTQALFAFVMCQ
jgi:hypothetical protein